MTPETGQAANVRSIISPSRACWGCHTLIGADGDCALFISRIGQRQGVAEIIKRADRNWSIPRLRIGRRECRRDTGASVDMVTGAMHGDDTLDLRIARQKGLGNLVGEGFIPMLDGEGIARYINCHHRDMRYAIAALVRQIGPRAISTFWPAMVASYTRFCVPATT